MRAVVMMASLLLGGCEMSVKQDGAGSADGNAAEGAVRDGQISIDTPGFDMKLDIPDALRSKISGDNDIVYPGSKVDGLNVTAGQDGGQGKSQVRISFSSGDAPAKVVAWYRDPARAADLASVSIQPDGTGFRISGTAVGGGDPFDLRLSPAAGGGTRGQLVLRDTN